MATSQKSYGFILFALIAIIGGLLIGKVLSTYVPPPSESLNIVQSDPAQQNIPAEDADFLASPPHYGPLIKTQEIAVTFEDDTATGILSAEKAEDVQVGQLVILYDKEGFTLPLGGKVSALTAAPSPNNKTVTVEIKLPEGTNTELLLADLDIITLESIASKRLPLSALQTDENGDIYVWVAKRDLEKEDKYKLHRQHIKVGLQDRDYFEEDGYEIETYDLIVLNPSDEIKSDKLYNIHATKLNAPLHNPVKQAWIDFELSRLDEQQMKLKQDADDCGKKQSANGPSGADGLPPAVPGITTLPDGTVVHASGGNACSATATSATSPIEIFRSLTKTGGSQDGNACGEAASACGQ